MSQAGTERSTSAVQLFGPESEGQLTLGGRDREDRTGKGNSTVPKRHLSGTGEKSLGNPAFARVHATQSNEVFGTRVRVRRQRRRSPPVPALRGEHGQ
jgi:hypothetical protein